MALSAGTKAAATDYGERRMLAVLERTTRSIEVGSWERFRDHAQAIGAGDPPKGVSLLFDGVPVVEVTDLEPHQIRVRHRSADREWSTRYRIPG